MKEEQERIVMRRMMIRRALSVFPYRVGQKGAEGN